MLILLLLALSTHIVLAEWRDELPVLPRHTPGFPRVVNNELGDYLTELLEELAKAQEAVETSDSFNEVVQDTEKREFVTGAIETLGNMGVLSEDDVNSLTSVVQGYSDPELLRAISDPELREMLIELYKASDVSPDDLEDMYKFLEKLRAEGKVSSGDYVAAMEILRRISVRYGYKTVYDAADKAILDTISQILRSEEVRGAIRSAIEALQEEGLPRLLSSVDSTSGIKLPELGELENIVGETKTSAPANMPILASFPSLPTLTGFTDLKIAMLIVLVIFCVVISVYLASRYGSALASKLRRTIALRGTAIRRIELEKMPIPVRLYWQSVEVVSAITHIRKLDVQTHREYLEKVSPHLGELAEAFKEVTESYEISRFGGVVSRDVEKRAMMSFRKLRGGGS